MAEYIDRQAAKRLFADRYDYGLARELDKIPAADVVEVVRCRECKHWHESTGYCEKHSYFIGADGMSCSPAESPTWATWDEDDFCSDGQRKEG